MLSAIPAQVIDSERKEMLDTIGVASLEDLVSHLPDAVRYRDRLPIADGKSEYEIMDYFRRLGETNAGIQESFFSVRAYIATTAHSWSIQWSCRAAGPAHVIHAVSGGNGARNAHGDL